NWGRIRAVRYRYVAKNLWRMKVADISYYLQYAPFGRWKNHGKYLKNVSVVYDHLAVAPGFTVDMTAKVMATLNFGTEAEPIAGIQTTVSHHVHSVLANVFETQSYVVQGDGVAYEVGSGFLY